MCERRRRARPAVVLVTCLVVAVASVVAGCSDGSTPPGPTLPAAAEAGREVVVAKGCAGCHSDDGEVLVGPSFKGLWGSEVDLDGGGTVTVDRDYLEESVRMPAAKRPVGASGQMPVFDTGRVSASDLDAIARYLEALAAPGS